MTKARNKRYWTGVISIACATVIWLGATGVDDTQDHKPANTPPEVPYAGVLKGKNLIVITVDTIRADHLSCYGGPKGLTPVMDKLAADGTLFVNAFSQTNVTNPSHTTIFTGLYAIDSMVMNNQTTFSFACPAGDTMALAFKRAGYRTAEFPATPHVSKAILNLPGFDYSPDVGPGLKASQNVDRAIEWLDGNTDKPFFMWLHFFDPHMKYEPPEPFRSEAYDFSKRNPTEGPEPPLGDDDNFNRSPDIVLDQFKNVRDRAYPDAMYRGEIRYTDDQIGRFLRYLKGKNLDSNTGIVLVGDHGESLGEHEIYYDHYGLFEVSLRVPMIMRLPGFPTGVRCQDRVSQIDIVPTICHLYGAPIQQPTAPLHGLNLTRALRGEMEPAVKQRDGFIHEDAHNRMILARKGPWKLIYQLKPKYPNFAQIMLFNTDNDPQEKTNLADKYPERVAQLKPLIQRWINVGSWGFKNAPETDPKRQAKMEAIRKNLASLGYVEAEGDAALRSKPLPFSPNGFQAFINSLDLTLTTQQKHRIEQIIQKYRVEIRNAVKKNERSKTRDLRIQMRSEVMRVLTREQSTTLRDALLKKLSEDEGK